MIGPIIPPSIPMVLYGLISDTSVGYLFLGGIIPGLIMGLGRCWLWLSSPRSETSRSRSRRPCGTFPLITLNAFPALMMPVVLLGGIYGGATTPTEAAAVAAAYAFVISVVLYRSVTVRNTYNALLVERAHDGLDRHADRRRAGVQLHRHR